MTKNKHIAVLMGGWNSEREVSLSSGEAVYSALVNLGYDATKIDFAHDIVEKLLEIKPDVVFNALHGTYGEDGRIQGLLDILKIKYTHSKFLSSVICMDKVLTKQVCKEIGIKFADYEIVKRGNNDENQKKIDFFQKPFVIKPISEGSSVGIEVVMPDQYFNIDAYEWEYGDEVIIENYIAGQEVQVALIDGKAIGVIEVRPKKLFYDYECKYTEGMTDYIMPAEIDSEKYQEVLDLAKKCYDKTGCKGLARVDFILNNKDGGDNEFYFLEINTHPGFTSTSLVPKIANYVGISFEDLVEFLVEDAEK